MKSIYRKLLFIPLVLFLVRIWGTIRFFLFATNWDGDAHESANHALRFLQVCLKTLSMKIVYAEQYEKFYETIKSHVFFTRTSFIRTLRLRFAQKLNINKNILSLNLLCQNKKLFLQNYFSWLTCK